VLDFSLTEDQSMFQKMVREFAQKRSNRLLRYLMRRQTRRLRALGIVQESR